MNLVFLCVANSARSQLAEGIARELAPDGVQVHSAGSQPTVVRPEAIAVLAEEGLDIQRQFSKGLDEVPLKSASLVVTLCAAESCPVLPPGVKHLHWPIPDPANDTCRPEESLHRFRAARDEIRARLTTFFSEWPRP